MSSSESVCEKIRDYHRFVILCLVFDGKSEVLPSKMAKPPPKPLVVGASNSHQPIIVLHALMASGQSGEEPDLVSALPQQRLAAAGCR